MAKKSGAKKVKMPKAKCCVSKSRCGSCPIRMLKEGRMPDGLTVKKRRLVDVSTGQTVSKKQRKKVAQKLSKRLAA